MRKTLPENAMHPSPYQPANPAQDAVVVGVDGSAESTEAVRWAAAEVTGRSVPLDLVHALALPPSFSLGYVDPAELLPHLRHGARIMLADAERLCRKITSLRADIHTEAPIEYPDEALVEASKFARLVVLGATGYGGFPGMLIGSVTDAVITHAHCPVAVIRGGKDGVPTSGPVVVGVDEWPATDDAIEAAFEQASLRSAPLVAVHAWTGTEAWTYLAGAPPTEGVSLADEHRRLLSERLAGWHEKYPDVTVRPLCVNDRPRHQLLRWSHEAQLLVVGSHGRGALGGAMLGSVSRAMVAHAACPVLLVRRGTAR